MKVKDQEIDQLETQLKENEHEKQLLNSGKDEIL